MGPMKCADIPDEPILLYLSLYQGTWATYSPTDIIPTVYYVFPEGIPEKLILAKMRQLHKRGLVGGCTCGCRGDFEITDKGLAVIGVARTVKYNGYGEVKPQEAMKS